MLSSRLHRIRAVLFLLVALGSAALVLVLWGFGVMDPLERQSIDARFSIRGDRTPPPDVVFVAIDDVTTDDLGKVVFPYPRRLHAGVIRRIAAGHPRAIAIDIQFTEQTNGVDDEAILTAVDEARASHIVLATTETLPNGRTRIFGGHGGGQRMPEDVGALPASGLFPSDSAGVIRKVQYEVNGLKTLAVVTVERATGKPVKKGPFGSGGAWIDYAGPGGTFTRYSYSRVLPTALFRKYSNKDSVPPRVPSSAFAGKIVVLGPAAPSLQDIHQTPVDQLMPGGEIQANAIATVLRGLPLRSVSSALTVFLTLLLALLVPAVSMGNKVWISMTSAALAAVGFAVAAQLSFDHGWILSLVYPLAALALSTMGTLGVHIVLTAFERETVRNVFSRYVPEAVVKDVLRRTDSDLRLRSEEVYGTVMFTDLRGFTSASEHLPAPQVIEMINQHLEEIVGAVLAEGGTLVSYTGDGIMAVFGAPIEQADHAERAFAAAEAMLERCLPRWNEWLVEQGLHGGIDMGIGLNSGPFMSGNIGSAQRLAYTVIGDTINTASRIETLTKETPYQLHVAESTYLLLSDEAKAKLNYIDELAIRGRTTKLKLWGMGLSLGQPEPKAGAVAVESAGDS
jgi:adenylate cyclase